MTRVVSSRLGRALAALALAAALALFLAVPPVAAAPDGKPALVRTIGNWRAHDPVSPWSGAEPWTVEDVLGFLELYPESPMDLGYRDGYPAGAVGWLEKGSHVDALQRLAGERGVDVDHRLCVSERPDVIGAVLPSSQCDPSVGGGGCDFEGDMDGRHGESETVVKTRGTVSAGADDALRDDAARWRPHWWRKRLLVLRPEAPDEERRRIVDNDGDTVAVDRAFVTPPRTGDAYEIRGSFDPAWIVRVPIDEHRRTMRRFWDENRNVCGPDPACRPPAEPLDPFHAENRRGWAPWFDRERIEALATATSVPALYGFVRDAGTSARYWEDPYYEASSVVVDVRNPRYREWRIRYFMYKLEDYGFARGEPVCTMISYKPGWHTHWPEDVRGTGTEPCSRSGTNLWKGPAQVCPDRSAADAPLELSPYGPGEFEAAISAYLRELARMLASAGWDSLRIIGVEAPSYPGPDESRWSILAEDVRRMPEMWARWEGQIEPRLAVLAAARGGSDPEPGDGSTGSTGSGGAPDDAGASTGGGAGGGSAGTGGSGGGSGGGSSDAGAGAGGSSAGGSSGGDSGGGSSGGSVGGSTAGSNGGSAGGGSTGGSNGGGAVGGSTGGSSGGGVVGGSTGGSSGGSAGGGSAGGSQLDLDRPPQEAEPVPAPRSAPAPRAPSPASGGSSAGDRDEPPGTVDRIQKGSGGGGGKIDPQAPSGR